MWANRRRMGGAAPAVLVGLCLAISGCFAPKETMIPLPNASSAGRATMPSSASVSHSSPYLESKPLGDFVAPAGAVIPSNLQQASYSQTAAAVGQSTSGTTSTTPVGTPSGAPCLIQGSMAPGPMPTELAKTSLPPYTVAPPDILVIDAVRLIPRPPYHVEPLEVLLLNVTDTLPNQPILGPFVVSPEGTINLGFGYGVVHVGGMTLEETQGAIRQHLSNTLRSAQVTVSLAQFRGLQQIKGEHLVRPDGTISLGTYGAVYVAGLSLGQIKTVVEKHLSEYLLNPQISVDVFAYNSMAYYVIFDGGGFGQQVFRMPVTGNETVLDAISQVQGLAPVSSKKYIWLARPSPAQLGCNQIMPVDWDAITQGGSTGTNYQIFPGDRIYVRADPLIHLDNYLSKVFAPIERVFGLGLLGTTTVQSFNNVNRSNNNGNTFP